MVIILTILGVILFFGIVRFISSPRQVFWGNLFAIWWLDLLVGVVENMFENLDDFTD